MRKRNPKCPYDGRTAAGRMWQSGYLDGKNGRPDRSPSDEQIAYKKGYATGKKEAEK